MVRFTTKKIESNTLGERMKKIREERRLTLFEISRGTNVQVKYLEYLESGNYSKLPAEVYVKGFLRNYANFIGANADSLIRQYEREKKIEQNIKGEKSENKNGIVPIKFSHFMVTPKIIIIFSGVIFIFSGFFYLYKQVNDFISTPRLVIMRPVDGETISGRNVIISGLAEKDSSVTINGQTILTNEKGEFSQEIGLGDGLNAITISAKNKFDKETTQAISVNAKYENVVESITAVQDNNINPQAIENVFFLELKVVYASTQISVEADGNLMYNGVLEKDTVQKFEAKKEISVTSGNGKNTIIKMEGKEEEKLGEKAEAVRDIVFTPNGRVEQANN